jgi:pyrroline-5-carboxylate reductase
MNGGSRLPAPTWFVGCGNMGGAIIEGWRASAFDLSSITVIRPSGAPVPGTRTVTSFAEAGPPPTLVVLAFKPQTLAEIAPQLRSWLTSKATVLSLLAGVECATLRELFPSAGAIARAIPNLPVAVRRGVVALYSDNAEDNVRQQLADLFAPLAFGVWMNEESKLAAVGSVAGAGPAYVARFIDALAKAGEERGLSREMASAIALETVLGTAWLAATTHETMEEIARRVASPKGTTQAGLDVLDREHVLDQLVGVTIAAAARRGEELAEEAKTTSSRLTDVPQTS